MAATAAAAASAPRPVARPGGQQAMRRSGSLMDFSGEAVQLEALIFGLIFFCLPRLYYLSKNQFLLHLFESLFNTFHFFLAPCFSLVNFW